MYNDIRAYNYYDDEPLISRMKQAKDYFDKKFAGVNGDTDFTGIEGKIDNINQTIINSSTQVIDSITESKSEIIDAIEETQPCLCNLATKEDVYKAKCSIINKIEDTKEEIIKEVDDKFVDLNELIKEK